MIGDPLLQTVLLVIGGIVAGIASGMGIGGGALLIPLVILVAKPGQQIVQAINLIFFIPAAIVALVVHLKNKMIDFKLLLPITATGLIGAFVGATVANSISGPLLRKLFGIFLLLMGFYEAVCSDSK